MSVLEELKKTVNFHGHEPHCPEWTFNSIDGECTCSYRRKIAFLERLEEPTEAMLDAGSVAVLDELSARGGMPERTCFKAMIEEAQK